MATVEKIIKYLPVGKSKAIHVNEFEQKVGNMPAGTNNDITRIEVRDAIRINKIPIGSSRSGYWLLNTDDEFKEVMKSIDSKIDDLIEKKTAMEKGWAKRKRSLKTNNHWPK